MAYDLGDTARLRFEVRDATGALVTPGGAVTLTITLPDGTTTSPANSTPATGVYVASYPTAQIGRHLVHWVAAGSNATSDTDILDVRPADRGWLISMADARTTLRLRDTTQDAEVRDWLGATTKVVERQTGRAWVERTRTETARGGRAGIPLIWAPVKSIVSMVPLLDFGITYPAADLVWNSSGILKLRTGASFAAGEYTVVYVAGDNTAITEDVTSAARIILDHLWETYRGQSLPGLNTDEDFPFDPRSGYALPNRARELLGDAPGGFA